MKRKTIHDPFTVLARCLGILCILVSLTTAWGGGLLQLVGYNGILEPNLLGVGAKFYPLALQHFISPGQAFDTGITTVNCLLAVGGACLYIWSRSAWAATGLYLTLVCFKQSVPLLAYGMFEFLQLGLFYIFVANAARAYYNARQRKRLPPETTLFDSDRLVGLFFCAHIALAYSSSGLCKAVGPHWWSGESMWRAFARTDSTGQRWLDMGWTGQFPWALQIIGIATVLLELLYPLAFWRKVRPFFVGCLMLMHFGTIVCQGLTLFGLTMISLNLFFWLESLRRDQAKHERASTLIEPDGMETQELAMSGASVSI